MTISTCNLRPITCFAIGITISNNDFNSTLEPWLKNFICMLVQNSYFSENYTPSRKLTKDFILNLFKRTIGSFYLIHQSEDLEDDVRNQRAIEYLSNYPVKIYLNEEVSDYLIACDYWHNCEFLCWFFNANSSDFTKVECI